MLSIRVLLALSIFFIFTFGTSMAFAASESFTVAARNYEQKEMYLNAGDEVDFSIQVQGGSNDDINLIIDIPDQDSLEGLVVENHSETFTAPSSGNYVFTFDNTISVLSNKSVLFSYDITKNTYYIYIENIPDYSKDYASNAVFDATEYWKSIFPKKNFYVADSRSNADIIIQWVKDFTGMKHVGFQYDRIIEVGLGDSSCLGQWNPYSSKHVTEIMTHEIGHAIGLKHSNDPNSVMYPTISDTSYGNITQKFNLGENQGMFIPFCMSKETSSIQYSVESSDSEHGFYVYVVPSKKDFDNILQQKSFVYYSDDDCFGEGVWKYSGECKGILTESGLAIIQTSPLSHSTSSINVNYFETDYDGKSGPFDTKVFPLIHDTATIDVIIFGDTYDFSSGFYQNKDKAIRFEDGNGHVIHRYDEQASIGQLFDSFGMSLTNDCFAFSDGRNFCNNDDYHLNFFVNEQKYSSLSQYVFHDGDNIKIIYDSIPKSSTEPKSSSTQISTEPYSKSKQETEKLSPEINNKVICGAGTMMKDGKCVVDSSNSSKGGGCLIATATYGSELAPQVQFLREIRDNQLMSTEYGISFMAGFNQFYYSFSPMIADYERENPIFKEAVKITITPLISSLSILNHVDMNSDAKVLGYGISLILLNVGMYIGIPASIVFRIKKKGNF